MSVHPQPKPTRAERLAKKKKRPMGGTAFKPTRYENEEYREFVREHDCSIEGVAGHRCYCEYVIVENDQEVWLPLIDAAHVEGCGLAVKADDTLTIPLCRGAHMEQHAITWERFEAKYGINRYEIACRLQTEWITGRAR